MSTETKLNEVIKAKGIKKRTIADRTGISRGVLYASLNGRREMRASELLAVCEFIEIDPNELRAQQ